MRAILLLPLAACAPVVVTAPVTLEVPIVVDDTRGRELFVHNWTLADEWSVDGDGLGPEFNATSCVACHGQGGVGGSGAAHHNVMPFPKHQSGNSDRATALQALQQLGLGGSSVFGPSVGPRNSTALFGAGLIDGIEDDVITEGALQGDPRFPKIKGVVARTPEGRVGRFGWKADVPLLEEFVARACAVELGLDVPGAPQGGARAPGLDLALDDVTALTSFVSSLPRPERAPSSAASRAGERIFDEIGCTGCHKERLGDVEGIYSDLLLHDMGPMLADGAGSWGAQVTTAVSTLWRTPPLWGVRDSGPWLHDGRAQDFDMVMRLHQGEAQQSSFAWRALLEPERMAVQSFLETLVAPGTI